MMFDYSKEKRQWLYSGAGSSGYDKYYKGRDTVIFGTPSELSAMDLNVELQSPDGTVLYDWIFHLCGEDVLRGLTGIRYKNYSINLSSYIKGSWGTLPDKTFVLFEASGTKPLLSYNYETKQMKIMPDDIDASQVKMADGSDPGVREEDKDAAVAQKSAGISAAKSACGKVDVGALDEVKNLLTASTIGSGIGAAGGIVGTVTGIMGQVEAGKEDGDAGKSKNLGLASTISSGVGALGAGTGAVTSGIALKKLKESIDEVANCKHAVEAL
ncbi:MAG: hypothetical protein LBO78_01745 [Rickettsiales bacterium]|jgi:hypothetical protein|nr:hypothetical protein [Rickettsiales bacterium]